MACGTHHNQVCFNFIRHAGDYFVGLARTDMNLLFVEAIFNTDFFDSGFKFSLRFVASALLLIR